MIKEGFEDRINVLENKVEILNRRVMLLKGMIEKR